MKMVEFATQPLCDFCPSNRTISYGIVQPGVHHAGGVPIVRVNNFENNKLKIIETLSVHPDIEAKYARSRPKAGDVLITLVGSIGQIAIAPDEIEGWNLARAVGLIPTRNIEDAKWIYFALQAPEAQQYMLQRANTTVQTTFNLGDLTKLPIPVPHLSERRTILEVLSSLDDKIELNRRKNETLEAMAQAIFKDWFVDFGPVRRKMQGETEPRRHPRRPHPGPCESRPPRCPFPRQTRKRWLAGKLDADMYWQSFIRHNWWRLGKIGT